MLGFKKKSHRNQAEKSEFVTVRAMYGYATHIRKNVEGSIALCGSSNLVYEGSATSRNDVVLSLPRQHEGWYWCATCASMITGMTVEDIQAARPATR